MIIFYIKMKIRAAGESFGAVGCSPLLFLFMGNTKNMLILYCSSLCILIYNAVGVAAPTICKMLELILNRDW